MKIHIIGGGNLGVAIALGISKYTKGNQVVITRRNVAAIAYLEKEGIKVSKYGKRTMCSTPAVKNRLTSPMGSS